MHLLPVTFKNVRSRYKRNWVPSRQLWCVFPLVCPSASCQTHNGTSCERGKTRPPVPATDGGLHQGNRKIQRQNVSVQQITPASPRLPLL